MFILDSLLIDGLGFVFDKIRVAAEAEQDDDEGRLREALLEGQTRLEPASCRRTRTRRSNATSSSASARRAGGSGAMPATGLSRA